MSQLGVVVAARLGTVPAGAAAKPQGTHDFRQSLADTGVTNAQPTQPGSPSGASTLVHGPLFDDVIAAPAPAPAGDAPVELPVPVQGQPVAAAKVVSGATAVMLRPHGPAAKSSAVAHGSVTAAPDAAEDAPSPSPVAAVAPDSLAPSLGVAAPLQSGPVADAGPVVVAPEGGVRGAPLKTPKLPGGGCSAPVGKAAPVSATREDVAQTASTLPIAVVAPASVGTAAQKDGAGVPTLSPSGHVPDAIAAHGIATPEPRIADAAKDAGVPEPSPVVVAGDASAWTADGARTLTATSQVLEVGVASGTHGWLRVRAELGTGGEVTASVVASSADAVKALHHEMPALGEYLAREQVGVASVAVSTAAGTGLTADASGEHNSREQPDQQAFGQGSAKPEAWDGGGLDGLFTMAPAPALLNLNGGGGWVNVRV